MGHVADTCQIASHDDSGSNDGGDSEVKMTRPVTGALHRPRLKIETRSSASSKEAACRLANRREATSWIEPRASTSRDGRRGLARRNFRTGKPPDQKSWDFDESEHDCGEKRNPPKPHAGP
jgi:hypothetical protein